MQTFVQEAVRHDIIFTSFKVFCVTHILYSASQGYLVPKFNICHGLGDGQADKLVSIAER